MSPPSARALERHGAALQTWHGEAAKAAEAFERRWTLRALERVDRGLARLLSEQRSLFDQVLVTGEAEEIEMHGAATVRGWQAAVRVMEAAAEPDDAYVLGLDPRTGCKVAIGERVSASRRVAELHGDRVVWLTPDEVATMYAGLEGFKTIDAIKRAFPGSEVIDVHAGETEAV